MIIDTDVLIWFFRKKDKAKKAIFSVADIMIRKLSVLAVCFSMLSFTVSVFAANEIKISDYLHQKVITYDVCNKISTIAPAHFRELDIGKCQSLAICTGSGCGKDIPDPGGRKVCSMDLSGFPISTVTVVNSSVDAGYPKTIHCVYTFK